MFLAVVLSTDISTRFREYLNSCLSIQGLYMSLESTLGACSISLMVMRESLECPLPESNVGGGHFCLDEGLMVLGLLEAN